MDHEGHSGTPQVSPVKAINLNAVFSPDKKMQSNKYVRRRVREASQTPISVKRLSKAARTRAALVDKDEMYAYVKEEMAKAEARMLACMTAFKSEMMGEMHALGTSMYAKWKEEMQTYSQQEMTAQLKAELVPLEGKIHAFMAKDMLKLVQEGLKVQGKAMKEACKQEVSIAVDNEIQKSKEAIAAMEASVSKVQENVEKNVHTWAEMAKDAVDKEVKECVPWIEVVKKNKGMPSNQMEVMNATLEEEAKRKERGQAAGGWKCEAVGIRGVTGKAGTRVGRRAQAGRGYGEAGRLCPDEGLRKGKEGPGAAASTRGGQGLKDGARVRARTASRRGCAQG
ncbi:hypothetical protein L7F22_031996 [Adiantum nelumboides]|nr:hypothetical protein [Adiantum nelumboides]